nr:MAG TPA: hypothetical protein [Bacteriophage sp.]
MREPAGLMNTSPPDKGAFFMGLLLSDDAFHRHAQSCGDLTGGSGGTRFPAPHSGNGHTGYTGFFRQLDGSNILPRHFGNQFYTVDSQFVYLLELCTLSSDNTMIHPALHIVKHFFAKSKYLCVYFPLCKVYNTVMEVLPCLYES